MLASVETSLAEDVVQVVPTITQNEARRFARDRLEDTYELLLGPTDPQPTVDPAADCRELYYQRAQLMRARASYRPRFWDEPRHVAAVFVGAVWTPAFYYLPYRALGDHVIDERQRQTTANLDHLRRASASLRCFER